MGTTHKKVIVRKMDRDTISGYVSAAFIADGKIEILNTAGNVVSVELHEVKGVYFVRELRRLGIPDSEDVYLAATNRRSVGAASLSR